MLKFLTRKNAWLFSFSCGVKTLNLTAMLHPRAESAFRYPRTVIPSFVDASNLIMKNSTDAERQINTLKQQID
jgi:hypothetical protein